MTQLLTAMEVADLLRLNKSSVYRMAKNKRIPYVRINGALRFREDDVEALIAKSVVNG